MPAAGAEEVLVKTYLTGICGTDLHIYNWDDWAQRNHRLPRIIGHELVGEVAAVGEGVRGFEPSKRVTAEGHINCGLFRNCRAGKRHLAGRSC